MRLYRQQLSRGNATIKPFGFTQWCNKCLVQMMFFATFYIHSKEFGLCVQWMHYELVVPEVYTLIKFLSETSKPRILFGNSMFVIKKYKNGIVSIGKAPRYDEAKF